MTLRMASPQRNKFGVYRTRVAVPESLRPLIGKRELTRSLDTKDPAEAKARHAVVFREFSQLLENAKRQLDGEPVLAPVDAEILADRWLREKAQAVENDPERRYRDWVHRVEDEDGSYYMDSPILWQLSEARDAGDDELADEVQRLAGSDIDRFLERQGIILPVGSDDYSRLCLRIAAKVRPLLRHVEAVELGQFPGIQAPRADKPLSVEKAAGPSGGMTISQGWTAFCEKLHRERPSANIQKRLDDYKRAILDFADFVGDKPMNAVSADDVRAYRDLLHRVPRRPGRAVKPLSLMKQVEQAEKLGLETLKGPSVRRRMVNLSALFTAAQDIPGSGVTNNPVHGVKLPPKKTIQAASKEKDYRPSELEALFSSDWFSPADSPSRWNSYGAATFWLPVLAYYTGARLEELAALSVADVQQQDGVDVLAILADDERTVKNISSVRRVPLHADVIALGFLDYVASLPKEGRLWPKLKRGKRNGYGYALSKAFGKDIRKTGIREGLQPFHAFRHTFATMMRRKLVDESIISRIDGHALQTQTSQYGSYPLELLKEAIDKLPTIPCFERLRGAVSRWKYARAE